MVESIMWRLASPDDDARVVELCLALYAEDPGTVAVDAAKMRRTLARFHASPERGRCLVLEVDGASIGYALLVPYWSNELGGNVCCVDELFVAPEARGRGWASGLLARLAKGDLGWPETVALELEVTPSNRRARALYVRHGFGPPRNERLRWRLVSPR